MTSPGAAGPTKGASAETMRPPRAPRRHLDLAPRVSGIRAVSSRSGKSSSCRAAARAGGPGARRAGAADPTQRDDLSRSAVRSICIKLLTTARPRYDRSPDFSAAHPEARPFTRRTSPKSKQRSGAVLLGSARAADAASGTRPPARLLHHGAAVISRAGRGDHDELRVLGRDGVGDCFD